MRDSKFGKLLVGIGATLGVVAGIALTLGFRPSQLPAAMLDLAAYKLTFIAVAVLMGSGAALRRYARQSTSGDVPLPAADSRALALGKGAAQPLDVPHRTFVSEQLNNLD